MSTALYTSTPNASGANCPYQDGKTIPWSDELPQELQALVVAPVSFKVFQDYEMQPDHTHGCDAANQPYCEFRYVLTQPRSDDDELFYEVPVYAESLTSWRLVDAIMRNSALSLQPQRLRRI
jgi:hypothetical protein